jgi:uncharacterized protein (TIGR03083 family)
VNPPAARRPGRSEPAGRDALTASVARLHTLVEALTPTDLRRGAYPTEWTIADVLSHLGSGAVIARMRLDAALAGGEADTGALRGVWDDWNAKAPEDQARDAQHADRSLLDALRSLTHAQRSGFRSTLGPLEVDFAGFVGLRLNEHAVHTWDIAVTFDHDAGLPADATAHLVEDLALIARFAGRPTSHDQAITVRTLDPVQHLQVRLGLDQVSLTAVEADPRVDVELHAEAFVRLVYGRLDPTTPHHSTARRPPSTSSATPSPACDHRPEQELTVKHTQFPARLAAGAYILHSGLEKWHGDDATAHAVHDMATSAGRRPQSPDRGSRRCHRPAAAQGNSSRVAGRARRPRTHREPALRARRQPAAHPRGGRPALRCHPGADPSDRGHRAWRAAPTTLRNVARLPGRLVTSNVGSPVLVLSIRPGRRPTADCGSPVDQQLPTDE